MSVPTFEEIKQALLIPDVNDDRYGRRYKPEENLPRMVRVSRKTIKYKNHPKGRWDG